MKDRAMAASREVENKLLRREGENLRRNIRKFEEELDEAKEKVIASGRAIQEIKDAL